MCGEQERHLRLWRSLALGRRSAASCRVETSFARKRHYPVEATVQMLLKAGCENLAGPRLIWNSEREHQVATSRNAIVALLVTLCGCADSQPIVVRDVVQQIETAGVETVSSELAAAPEGSPRQQAAVILESVSDIIADDPDQLWFQLQARSRRKGMEELQKQLMNQIPDETLIARTSWLTGPQPGIVKSWHLSRQVSQRPFEHMAISGDRTKLYFAVAGAESADLVVLDLKSLQAERRIENVGGVLMMQPSASGDVYMAVRDVPEKPRQGAKVGGPVTTREQCGIFRLKDGQLLQEYQLGQRPFPEGAGFPTITSDGNWVVTPKIYSFGMRSLQDWDMRISRGRRRGDSLTEGVSVHSHKKTGKAVFQLTNGGQVLRYPDPEKSNEYEFLRTQTQHVVHGRQHPERADLLVISRTGLALIDLDRFAVTWRMSSGDRRFTDAAFLNTEGYIAAGHDDGKVSVWKAEPWDDPTSDAVDTLEPIAEFSPHAARITHVVQVPGTDRVFTADWDGHLRLIEPLSVTELPEPVPPDLTFNRKAFSIDGQWAADFDEQRIVVFDPRNQKVLHDITIEPAHLKAIDKISSVALVPDTDTVVVAGRNHLIHCDLKTAEQSIVRVDSLTVRYLLTGHDGKVAVATSKDQFTGFDTVTGKQLWTAAFDIREQRSGTVITHDGRVALWHQSFNERKSLREGVKFLDLKTGELVADNIHGATMHSVKYANLSSVYSTLGALTHAEKGKVLSTSIWNIDGDGSRNDGERRIGGVTGFTDDGTQMVTHMGNGTICIWELPERKLVHKFALNISPISDITFDGTILTVIEGASARTGGRKRVHRFEYRRSVAR